MRRQNFPIRDWFKLNFKFEQNRKREWERCWFVYPRTNSLYSQRKKSSLKKREKIIIKYNLLHKFLPLCACDCNDKMAWLRSYFFMPYSYAFSYERRRFYSDKAHATVYYMAGRILHEKLTFWIMNVFT